LRESYPNWHREVVMLGDYHYFLGELELSTRRALRLEEQLVAERERLTKLVEADRTVADNSNQD